MVLQSSEYATSENLWTSEAEVEVYCIGSLKQYRGEANGAINQEEVRVPYGVKFLIQVAGDADIQIDKSKATSWLIIAEIDMRNCI